MCVLFMQVRLPFILFCCTQNATAPKQNPSIGQIFSPAYYCALQLVFSKECYIHVLHCEEHSVHYAFIFCAVIGGVAVITNMVSGALANFDDKTRKWCHKFPAMLTGRCASSAVATDDYLFVIGGIAENDRVYLDVVEVLDLKTMKWARASPVPKPVTFMSITVCSNMKRIYLLGGCVSGV